MNERLLELEDFTPLSAFAPNFAKWLAVADRNSKNDEIMRFYGQQLTASEAAFCGSYARHIILGTQPPNLEEGSFDYSPVYRQCLLEKIVRERLKSDNYVFPLAVRI